MWGEVRYSLEINNKFIYLSRYLLFRMEPEEKPKDIFSGTSIHGHEEKPGKEPASFSKGLYNLLEGFGHIFKGVKHLLFKRFYMNVFLMLIIIAATATVTYYTKESFEAAVNVTCPVCPECNETECEETECPELECPECEPERINVIYYTCPNGKIVNDSTECSGLPIELTSSDYETSQGILLAINNVDYELTGNNTGRIKRINYTIINQGSFNVLPRIEVKVYETWDSEVSLAKAIMIEDILGYNDWIIRSDSSNIHFTGFDQTIRLELINKLDDESIVAVTKNLEISE